MENDNMIEALCDSDSSALLAQVDALLVAYRAGGTRSPLHAIIDIMAKSCGAGNVEIKPDDVREAVDVSAVLENLYSCVDPESSAYFLVNKDVKYKKFPQRFHEMWKYVVKSSFSADILFQEAMLPTFALWLVAMSESKCRSFRHSATVAVMDIIQALNELAESLKARLSFIRTANEMPDVKENLDQVVKWRDHLFSQTVHQRLRDMAPEIRLATIQQLAKWTLGFPEEFMEKQYLRYFGMPLHDKRPALRAEALDMILQCLGRVDGAFIKMKLFLDYFIKRIVEMSTDVDTKCAELALRVMAMIVKRSTESAKLHPQQEETISSEMIDAALRALFDERRSVREAAGVLLHVFVYTRFNSDDEEYTEEDRWRVCAELICSFAGTLRTQYKEAIPERYIVDALWVGGLPPPLLTETRVIPELALSANQEEAVVGLGFLAAILRRLQDHLCLGPTPKDERRLGAPKLTAAKKDQVAQLTASLSVEAVHVLATVFQRHHADSVGILRCAAEVLSAVHLGALTTSTDQAALSSVMAEFQKITSKFVAEESTDADAVMMAWYALMHTDHPLRSEAEGHLTEIQNQVVRQLEKVVPPKSSPNRKNHGREQAALAERCRILSSLTNIATMLPLMEVAFHTSLQAAATEDPRVTRAVASCMLNHILWSLRRPESGRGTDEHDALLLENVQKLVTLGLTLPGGAGEQLREEDDSYLTMGVHIFSGLCDVAALPLCTLAPAEQERLLKVFEYLFERVAVFFGKSQEMYRAAHGSRADSAPVLHEELHQSRAVLYQWESNQLRVVQGVIRLFLLNKLSSVAVTTLLFFWTQTSSKPVSSAFKDFFHKMRESTKDSFALERDTLAEAYNRCVQVGATPLSVEDMFQIGMKLSSLHFPISTDKYYSACLAMVQYGIEFASTVDPLILQGVLPYCTKLKVPEALHILRHEVPSREIFKVATNPYVRAFISALSRAAKIEDPTTTGTSSTGISTPKKRSRDLRGMSESGRPETALDELVESVQSLSERSPISSTRGGQRGSHSASSRVVTSDGWHVREEEGLLGSQTSTAMPSQQTSIDPAGVSRRKKLNLPSTPETAASEGEEGEMEESGVEEVFIDVHDYKQQSE